MSSRAHWQCCGPLDHNKIKTDFNTEVTFSSDKECLFSRVLQLMSGAPIVRSSHAMKCFDDECQSYRYHTRRCGRCPKNHAGQRLTYARRKDAWKDSLVLSCVCLGLPLRSTVTTRVSAEHPLKPYTYQDSDLNRNNFCCIINFPR